MGLAERIAEFTDLPKDILCGDTIIRIIAQKEVYVANHRGIIACDSCEMVFYTKNGKCKVSGANLQIKEISSDSIYFSGKIKSVEYL